VQDPNSTLDYSSPVAQRAQAKTQEQLRQESLENYNESTLGERHPLLSVLWSIVLFALAACVVVLLLPREVARPVLWVSLGAVVVWRLRNQKTSPTITSIANPLRWW
jgi:hypothetical protein